MKDIRLPGKIGDEDPLMVSHPFRLDVLVGGHVLPDGADMDASLMGKGAIADIGKISWMGQVGELGHETGNLPDLFELVVGDAIDPHLQLEVRDDGTEIGIAAPLAVTIDGSLDHVDPFLDGKNGVGHSQFGVVMDMNAERNPDLFLHLLDDRLDLAGEGASIGIAEYDPVGSGLLCRSQRWKGRTGIMLVSVEEVFGVEEHFSGFAPEAYGWLVDHLEVLIEGDLEGASGDGCPRSSRRWSCTQFRFRGRPGGCRLGVRASRPAVLPNATTSRGTREWISSLKYSRSLGFDPGHPPSM